MVRIGIDLGSQKTVVVADNGDLVLTPTGGINSATLVAFFGRTRLVGEDAAPQISGDATVPLLNALLGKSIAVVEASGFNKHRKVAIRSDDAGRLICDVNYCDEVKTFSTTALLGMFLAKTNARINEVYPASDVQLTFALPPAYSPSVARAVREGCTIAGIDLSKVTVVDASDGLVAAYNRKLQALRGPEKANLDGKRVLLVEMGHTQTTAVVVDLSTTADNPTGGPVKVAVAHDSNLGALHFDLNLFDHFALICQQKAGGGSDNAVVPGSKRGQRLLMGCERLRKLLSQLPESSITVENMSDAGDVNFALKRDDLSLLCADLLVRFKGVLTNALTTAGAVVDGQVTVGAVEVLGGGVRMQVVQQAITEVVGSLPLGAKLDDASSALGCALVATQRAAAEPTPGADAGAGAGADSTASAGVPAADEGVGLTADEIAAARSDEVAMQGRDAEITLLLAARNELESYLLEMRAIPRRKHGEKVDAARLNSALDEVENWMWDVPDAGLADLHDRFASLKTALSALCGKYVSLTEADRVAVEEALAQDAQRAAEERAANGEDDDDHDNRKLKKPDRMRLVVKNKEEGTELFKGGNYRPAAARYHKSLSHAAKFFDLSPDDEKEVKGLQTLLYLNLASCYIKMDNWDQVGGCWVLG